MQNEPTRIMSIMETWGNQPDGLTVRFLASESTYSKTSLPPDKMIFVDTTSRRHHVDGYFSTLAKGLLGLREMLHKFPNAKWYVIAGDDNFIDASNLADIVSSFDPDQEWCLAQTESMLQNLWNTSKQGPLPEGSAWGTLTADHTSGSAWRVYGGAPIITSRALTKRLASHIQVFNNEADPAILHDVQFTKLMQLHGGGAHKITHVDGLYSQAPGPFLRCPSSGGDCAKSFIWLPNKLMTVNPAAFHQIITRGYMRFLHMLFKQSRLCRDSSMLDQLDGVVIGLPSNTSKRAPKGVYGNWWDSLGSSVIHMKSDHPLEGLQELVSSNPTAKWYFVLPAKPVHFNAKGLASLLWNLDAETPQLICGQGQSIESGFAVSLTFARAVVQERLWLPHNKMIKSDYGIVALAHKLAVPILSRPSHFIIMPTINSHLWPTNLSSCALVFPVTVDLSGMEWAARESVAVLAHVILDERPTSSDHVFVDKQTSLP